MEKSGLISIIVPVYNVESYLCRCLDSILNQTYNNIEIILVDDGSTDRSGEICDAYKEKDSRISVIHKLNGGLSSARNCGLEIAKGEYIGFVDSDDYIASDMYALLHSYMRDDVDIVSCRMARINKEGHIKIYGVSKIIRLDNVQALKEMLHVRHLSISSCDKLYKKEVLKGIRFPVGRTAEDLPFVYNVVKNCRNVINIGACKYYYCYREDSISHKSFFTRRVDYALFARDILEDIVTEYPMLRKDAEARYVQNIMSVAASIKESPNRDDYEYMRKRLVKAVRRMILRIIVNPEMSYEQKINCITLR